MSTCQMWGSPSSTAALHSGLPEGGGSLELGCAGQRRSRQGWCPRRGCQWGGTLHLAPQLRVQGLQPSPLDVAGRGWCLHGVSPLCCGRRRPRPLTTHTVALGEG